VIFDLPLHVVTVVASVDEVVTADRPDGVVRHRSANRVLPPVSRVAGVCDIHEAIAIRTL
jgi:hypothetical protein